jgi:hypothetical protein
MFQKMGWHGKRILPVLTDNHVLEIYNHVPQDDLLGL